MLGIAPIMVQDDSACFIGSADVCDYMDFIVAPGHERAFFASIVEHLRQQKVKRLNLGPLRADSAVLSYFKTIAPRLGCMVTCEPEDVSYELEFHGDEGDFMEVAGNLLDNAFKWCDKKVSLEIKSLEKTDIVHEGIVLTVEDDGPGIPPKLAKQVIQRGVRADEGIQGHGIGLSVVQDIVQIYGGSLTINTGKYGGAGITASLMTKH